VARPIAADCVRDSCVRLGALLDPQSYALLKAFDAPDLTEARTGLSLQQFVLRLACDVTQLRPLVEQLVACGWLRFVTPPVPNEDASAAIYHRTEDGRLAIAGPLDVTMYTRGGCHLCEQAKAEIQPLLRHAGAMLTEIDIDADAVLRERYNIDIPVILLGTRKIAKHRVDLEQFRRQLEEARHKARSL